MLLSIPVFWCLSISHLSDMMMSGRNHLVTSCRSTFWAAVDTRWLPPALYINIKLIFTDFIKLKTLIVCQQNALNVRHWAFTINGPQIRDWLLRSHNTTTSSFSLSSSLPGISCSVKHHLVAMQPDDKEHSLRGSNCLSWNVSVQKKITWKLS